MHLRVAPARGRARPAAGRGPVGRWRTVSVGIVGSHRAGADEDGVALGPQPVGVAPGGLAGDPLARAVGRRGAPVERGRQLQHDIGPAGAAVLQVRRELGPRPRPRTRRPRPRCPRRAAARCRCPATFGSGSSMPTTTRATPGLDDRVGAGRGAAVVRAGLEGREERRPLGPRAGRSQRHDLGVRTRPVVRWRLRSVSPSGVSTTHPTHGFGDVRLRAPAAAAIARCIRWCSLALVLTASSVRDQGSRSVHEDADTTAGARPVGGRSLAPIRTHRLGVLAGTTTRNTVGPGIPPGRPTARRPKVRGLSPPVRTHTHTPRGVAFRSVAFSF